MHKPTLKYWVPLVLAWLVWDGSEATAQQARSFEQLQVLVRPNDTVSVLDTTGKVTKGRILKVTDSTLQLMTEGTLRELSQKDTMQIRQKSGDSLSNGAKYGAVIGGGFGALMAAGLLVMVDDCIGCAVGVAGVYTAIGAGVGVGIDALIRRERIIFAVSRDPSNRVSVTPLLIGHRKGVALSWSF